MNYIGNQTSFAANPPTAPFEYALANGFNAFEWFPDKKPGAGWDETDLDEPLRRELRERARGAGMRISFHARWQANPLQTESHSLLWKDLELARELGAVVFNIHFYHERGVAEFVKGILPLIERTVEAGVTLTIENTPHHSPEMFNELFEAIRGLGKQASQVGFCFDMGHANLCSATRNRYLEFIDRLDAQVPVLHVHAHENWGDADTHLPLFTGPAGQDDSGVRGLIERLGRRDFSGSIILEQWPQPPSLLNQAKERLRGLSTKASGGRRKEPPADGLAKKSRNGAEPPSSRDEKVKAATRPTRPSRTQPSLRDAKGPSMSAGAASEGGSFGSALIVADKQARSWREKLESVRRLLSGVSTSEGIPDGETPAVAGGQVLNGGGAPERTALLTDLAIYLRFLGTGRIQCVEDGRHFRPGHHARIASEIREWVNLLAEPSDEFVVRKIYPWLPSSAESFRRAEPLTRIRDIAHRNDIPSDLKKEIKDSLQNKLHRCAGPEDLATSAALLKRFTAPGASFPPEFISEFKRFHEELEEFFNARSLEDRLKGLRAKLDAGGVRLVDTFLGLKDSAVMEEQLEAFSTLTELRRLAVARGDGAGSAAAAGEESGRQELVLADIALEDFAFVLMSRMLNAAEPSQAWLLEMLPVAVANLSLSGIEPEECRAIEAELRAWLRNFNEESRDELLRLKAAVERSRRLAETYSEHLLRLFTPRVEALGRGLGISAGVIRVFCEADIRGHIVFQLSKLASELLRRLRQKLGLPAWDSLVTGEARGTVTSVENLDELGAKGVGEGASVVLLGHAAGDEEIPRGVGGIVLAHDLPHLSHLAVRARQARVVFAVCEEPARLSELKALEGKRITLVATVERVSWSVAAATPASAGRRGSREKQDEALVSQQTPLHVGGHKDEGRLIGLEQALLETCGAKAFNARRLAELASSKGSPFKTLQGAVVSFGAMEAALKAVPEASAEYGQLVRGIENSERSDGQRWDELSTRNLAANAEKLRGLVRPLRPSAELVSMLSKQFGAQTRFMVRSSSNCEDLSGLAGAGLYESVANVALNDVPTAVAEVWSSLWTIRAALSRQQTGIPHTEPRMAVLIQPMVEPDFSFVLHTVNPINANRDQVYAELAVGLGETLVSGEVRGTPFRLIGDKGPGSVEMLAFANFSCSLHPGRNGDVEERIVDYSRVSLSCEEERRKTLAKRLTMAGRVVEEAFQEPQDIEGAMVGEEMYLVQARPQQGLQ